MRVRTGIVSVSVTTVSGTYKDLADFGLTVDGWGDAMSMPSREYPTGSRPGRIGGVKLATTALYKSKQIIITGTVTSDTFAAHITAISALEGWCARAVALKVSGLDSARFLECNLVNATVTPLGIPAKTPASSVALTFEALESVLWQSTSTTTNSLTTSLTEQALGTAPVRPVITVTGNPSAFSLTYANSAGTTVQTLALAGLTTSGATSIVIDMNALTIVQTVSAVAASVIAKLTTGDFFALDPADADTVTPTWCKVSYAATGTVSAVSCAYRKSYY